MLSTQALAPPLPAISGLWQAEGERTCVERLVVIRENTSSLDKAPAIALCAMDCILTPPAQGSVFTPVHAWCLH